MMGRAVQNRLKVAINPDVYRGCAENAAGNNQADASSDQCTSSEDSACS
jgi:hypothetical protein